MPPAGDDRRRRGQPRARGRPPRGAAAGRSAPPGPARPSCWRGGWRDWPRAASTRAGAGLIGSTRATARRLRERAEALLAGAYEELWVGTWEELGERLLREHSRGRRPRPLLRRPRPGRAAGDAARPARRAAAAPARDPRQPGRPAGAAAGADRRAEGGAGRPDQPRGARPPAAARRPATRPTREAARRELEFAELYTAHDRILAESRQPRPRRRLPRARLPASSNDPTCGARSSTRFEQVMVDELEETTRAQRALLASARRRQPQPPLRARGRGGLEELVRARSTPAARCWS